MTFIIHGATGAQGAPVAAALFRAGHPVTAAVRNVDTFSGDAVSVDLADLESLVAAYTDAEGVFIHLPLGSPDQQLAHARTIATAVQLSKPARVVFSTSGYDLGDGDDSPHGVLSRALQNSGVSAVTVAPKLYLENLLLPPVTEAAHDHGVLPYPIRDDYAVSWSSHLDVADVVVRLFERTNITGVVAIGALPGLVGKDLAAGFSSHLGREVTFEAQTPEEFGNMIIPIFGEAGIAPVVDGYRWRATQSQDLIDDALSAQQLLGMEPRTVEQWLHDVNA